MDDNCDDTHTFRSRRQMSRDIINSRLKKKFRKLTKRIEQIEHNNQHQIIDSGECDYFNIKQNQTLKVKIMTSCLLQGNMHVFISITVDGEEISGLLYHLIQYKENDDHIMVVVQNTVEQKKCKLSYIITS